MNPKRKLWLKFDQVDIRFKMNDCRVTVIVLCCREDAIGGFDPFEPDLVNL